MAKRPISSIEAESSSSSPNRRSTRVTKKVKVSVEETVEVEGDNVITTGSVQLRKASVSSSKRKGKGKAAAQDEVDLSTLPRRVSSAWKVGAHVSAAGGVENSILNAAKIGANAFALFLKSQKKWTSPDLTESSIASFKSRMSELSYSPKHVLPHGSYLINLGNPDADKREKSYECFLDDLKRCDQLGLGLYNFHPGSTLGIVEPSISMTHIADCINRCHRDMPGSKVVAVLENMAGAGNVIGSNFAHLGEIIRQVEDKTRVGVCLDTCHMFAAGYDIRSKEGWESTVEAFNSLVGLKYLRGMHINDSKTECGSKKDRHDNIGVGYLSLSAFSHILTDPRMQDIPLILETPSHEETSKNWDVWSKEIEVLNVLSSSGCVPTARTSETSAEVPNGEGRSDIQLDSLALDIRNVVKAAGGGKAAKQVEKRKKKASVKKGKKDVDDVDEYEEE